MQRTATKTFRLSKTSFLEGRQCRLRLWLRAAGVSEDPPGVEDYHDPIDDFLQQSRSVESVAQRLFPGGLDVGELSSEADLTEDGLTRGLLEDPSVPSLFQARFETDHLVGVTDILRREGDCWVLYEVKASTKMKPMFHWDLAFQWRLLSDCGVRVKAAKVLLLNKEYAYPGGEHDPQQLLVEEDCTAAVRELLPLVDREITLQQSTLAVDDPPVEQPGSRCRGNRGGKNGDRPSDCGHLHPEGRCGCQLPEHWSLRLPNLSTKKHDLIRQHGTYDIRELDPYDERMEWTDLQQRVIEAVRSGEIQVDRVSLQNALGELRWPVAFIDFEYDPGLAVPPFVGMRPYDKVPFQWSVHIQHGPDEPLTEASPFLHLEASDPREAFIESLLAALPETGSVVLHYAGAESGVLNSYRHWYPGRYDSRVDGLQDRFFDTHAVAKQSLYHPAMRCSFSIKDLGPALAGRGYEDLAVQGGMEAVREWRRLVGNAELLAAESECRQHLLEYCGRDTELLFDVVTALRRLIRKPR